VVVLVGGAVSDLPASCGRGAGVGSIPATRRHGARVAGLSLARLRTGAVNGAATSVAALLVTTARACAARRMSHPGSCVPSASMMGLAGWLG
jgi:hypothetical protein